MQMKFLSKRALLNNSSGYVLVAALMILLVLTLIGIAANQQTNIELQIAANNRWHKQAFYEADGGTEFAAELLEQNIACIKFDNNNGSTTWLSGSTGPMVIDNTIAVENGSVNFWQNSIGTWSNLNAAYPTDANRDLFFPPNYAAGEPHTNITVEGTTNISVGSSIIMAAGYLGLGRSASSGGVTLDYQIHSQHIGAGESENRIRIEWRHVVGREDPFCNYD